MPPRDRDHRRQQLQPLRARDYDHTVQPRLAHKVPGYQRSHAACAMTLKIPPVNLPQLPRNPLFKRLLPLGYALVVIVAVILFFTWAALQGQTALAGTLNGESVWSKAQNHATFALFVYASSGNEVDYADFLRNYGVVTAYNSARDMTLSGSFDYNEVVKELHRAYVLPVAVPSIIFLFSHAARGPYLKAALKEWYSTDSPVAELGRIAAELHSGYTTGHLDRTKIASQLRRISAINTSVQGATNRFSAIVATASVAFARVVSIAITFFVVAALLVWGWIARRVLTRIRSDQERYSQLFDGTADAIVMVDEGTGRIVEANPAAGAWTGRDSQTLRGTQFASLFTRSIYSGKPWSDNELRDCDGSARSVEIQSHLIALDGRMIRQAIIHDVSAAEASRLRLEHIATHDALTGLVNRREFERLCEVAVQCAKVNRTTVAVLFIDLDGFKAVNDNYGHAIGDRLLVAVSERIADQLRKNDVAGRIGGDEFIVLVPQVARREVAASLARRLCSALAEPFEIDTYEIAITASIGVAIAPDDGRDVTDLVGEADAAMYVAKTEERNTWRFYTPAVHAKASGQKMLVTELRGALARGEFRLLYQPIIEMESGRINAIEALLRWQHPKRGLMLPDTFISIAEEMGLIRHIDEWVMRTACAQIRTWDQSDIPPIRVSLNVSARWFGHAGFVEAVQDALQESAVAPQRLVLEITEGAILRLGKDTDRTLRELAVSGIGISIDDFGTGYASMAYLKLPAVAYLKIDRSFITGLPTDANNAVITHAVVAMAKKLGLVTIAEGVETEAEHEFLLQTGCAEAQGYLYSQPLPPGAIEGMLRAQRPRHRVEASA